MKPKFFELAKKLSKKSTYHKEKIGGVLVNKSKIISVGFNKFRTHTKSNTPFRMTHCELSVLIGLSFEETKGCTLYLYREHSNGQPAMSRPCQYCQELLILAGVKKVCYTGNGDFQEELVSNY